MNNSLPDSFLIPANQLVDRSPIPLAILPDLPALHAHFARAVADEIMAA